MEIVLALAAIVGISLIALPRLRRRRRGRARANAGKQWSTSHTARRRSANGSANGSRLRSRGRTAAVATGAGVTYATASDGELDWDDDLDWGTDTAVATPAPPVEADEPAWDDEPATNGNGNGAITAEPPAPTNGAAPTAPAEPTWEEPAWDDWDDIDEEPEATTPAPVEEEPAPPELHAPAAADGATPAAHTPPAAAGANGVTPAAGGAAPADTPPASDWDWEPAPAATNGASAPPAEDDASDWDWEPAPAAAAAPATKARQPRRKLNPLVLVALYAAVGIGVIVIGVSLFTSAMSGKDDPPSRTSAEASPEPTATPTATPAAQKGPTAAEKAEFTRLQQAFADQRRAAAGQELLAVRRVQRDARRARAARRAARRRAADRRRAAARRRAAQTTPTPRATPTPQGPTYTPPSTAVAVAVAVVAAEAAAVAAASSASSEACPRLDGLPGRELTGGYRVAEADSRAARMKGLAKLDDLPERLALHIPRCRSVHTFTMRFPLDLIWLDKQGRVVRIDPAVPPRRLKWCVKARSVVEANAGTAADFVAAGL